MNRKQHRNEHWKSFKQGAEWIDYLDVIPQTGWCIGDARVFLIYYNSAFPEIENNKK